ncbi:acyltransferase family protein [Paenibacillus sp. NEAU-GSW1]|nr:acyltransferase family protein [Paenibacillus sp. NEAU-GSW1]MUT66304.1 acyltransferase family protein [Paenibacillus sp. NEAU-GSW1]
MPGLDGLRALAVLAVIAYHLRIPGMEGGLVGVTIFFVLSGYLITDILLIQREQHGGFALRLFWIRRARRLLPAMLLMLALSSLWLIASDASRLLSLRDELLSGLVYMYNWQMIAQQVSYFESFGPPSPFGHIWSLAVEEQFYVVWPLALALLIRMVKRRGKLVLWLLGGAACSAMMMAMLYHPGEDPSRVYYGTDTRAFALLLGSALAVVWPSRRLSTRLDKRGSQVLDGIGIASLAVLLLFILRVGHYSPFLYRGGMFAAAVATAALTAVLAHPASRLGKLASGLKWIGVRSYGIYLYHYPIIVLTTPLAESQQFHLLRSLAQMTATLLLAELSYRFVEMPIRQGELASMVTQFRRRTGLVRLGKESVVAIVALVVLGACLAANSDNGQLLKVKAEAAETVSTAAADAIEPLASAEQIDSEATPTPEPAPVQTMAATAGASSQPSVVLQGDRITVIGDSVILGVVSHLEKRIPGIGIDGKIGRQLKQANAVVEQLKEDGRLGETVVIELGSNGAFTNKQLTALISAIGDDRRIMLINTRVPKEWQNTVNEMLSETAEASEGRVELVDWFAASEQEEGYFADDGVHLTRTGAEAYADMLMQSLLQ